MVYNSLALHRPTRPSGRGGFTLVELLVVIGIIAILAGVALGPITGGIEKAKENAAMQQVRQIGLLAFSYANDNSQQYPYGSNANTIAKNLLDNGYANDPGIFFVSGGASTNKGTGASGTFTMPAGSVAFDFLVNTTGSAGLTSTASDSNPLIVLSGSTIPIPAAAGGATDATLTATCPFGNYGLAVCYKSNSSYFKRAVKSSGTAKVTGIFDASYYDASCGSYGWCKAQGF